LDHPSAATELRYVKRALREADLAGVTRIHVIRPDRPIAAAQWRYDEFAVPTTAFAQDVPWIVKAAMKEVGRLEQWNYDIVGNGAKGEANVPRDGRTLVIDMTELEGLR